MQSGNTSLRKLDAGAERSRQSVDEWLEAAMAERARKAAEKRPEPGPAERDPSFADAAPTTEHDVQPHAEASRESERRPGEPETPHESSAGGIGPVPAHDEAVAADEPAPIPAVVSTVTSSQSETLLTFEQRIKEISDRLNASKPIGRRGLAPRDEVDLAVTEIRRHQAGLATQTAVGRALEARISDSTMRGYTDTLAAMRADLARIMGHVETPRAIDTAPVDALRQEVADLRHSLHDVASRDDVARVESSVDTLARTFEAPGGIVPLAPYSRELEALRAEIERLSETHQRGEGASIARNLDLVSHKIDMLIAGGLDVQVLGLMARQVEELRDGVARSATTDDVQSVAHQVAELRTDVAAMADRQVDSGAFTSLRVAVQEVRDALERPGFTAAVDASQELREGLQPIQSLLSTLVEKVDRVEQRHADPVALDQLEAHLSALNASFRAGTGDTSLRALEQAMGDLLNEVATWRQGTIEVAERAARSAVAETLEASPPGGAEGRHAALATRTQEKLDVVQSMLSDVAKRLGDLESAALRRSAPPVEPIVAEPVAARLRGGAAEPVFSAEPSARIVPSLSEAGLDEADEPLKAGGDEILLEPGAGRPVRGIAAADDIKSSFINAARRAAQAAAADAAKERGSDASEAAPASGGLRQAAARMRSVFETHRRQLLIGAAAIALAIGVFQLVQDFGSGNGGTRSASGSAPVATAAPTVDPTTTQSVTVVAPDATQAPVAVAVAPETAAPAEAAATPGSAEPKAAGQAAVDAKPAAAPAVSAAVSDPAKPAGDVKPAEGSPGEALNQAANAGNPQAQYELASRMSEGRGVPRNPQGAAALLEKAAEKGLAPAQYRLANLYEKGTGVARNIETAKSWYRKAAEGGNIRAMHNLAVLMAEGSDGKPDYAAAVGWFQRAAEFGVRDSQYNLAVLYARGLGIGQDLGKSYTWFALAAGQGDADAAKKRDEVAARLPASDLARLKASVEKWKPAPASTAANEVTAPAGGWGGDSLPKTRGTTG